MSLLRCLRGTIIIVSLILVKLVAIGNISANAFTLLEQQCLASLNARGLYCSSIASQCFETYESCISNQTGCGNVLNTCSQLFSPNLIAYVPSGWSDGIVVSKTSGTTIDSSSYSTLDNIYIDWAVINNGTRDVTSNFTTKLYIDGIEKASWSTASLLVQYFTSVKDYNIGSLSAGSHVVKIVTDATSTVSESNESDNEYIKTITVTAPNLIPYMPANWTDKIVISNTSGTTADSPILTNTDTFYIDWAVINNGNANAASPFYTKLYVDGVEKFTWSSDSLAAQYYISIKDYNIGSLSAGSHVVKIVTDATSTVSESNESDNEYIKTITVSGAKAKIGTSEYASFAEAYTAASSSTSTTIMLLEDVHSISNVIDKPLILRGGHLSDFTRSVTGYSTLQGPLIIRSGSVIMDRVIIK
jgi:hypothetical protein